MKNSLIIQPDQLQIINLPVVCTLDLHWMCVCVCVCVCVCLYVHQLKETITRFEIANLGLCFNKNASCL
jgi:hypothetical protein